MPARYLRGNQGTETPSSLIFFDTESHSTVDPDDSRKRHLTLRLWCATFVRMEKGIVKSRTEYHGTTSESFWTLVINAGSERNCTWVFAHNLAFDLTQVSFWDALDNGLFTTAPLFRKDKEGNLTKEPSWTGKFCLEVSPFFIQCRSQKQTYKMVDTSNYWPKSLYKIGERIGLSKGKLPEEHAIESEWLLYCKRDVEIIEHAVLDLMEGWRREDCGVFKMTAPQLALTNFQHTCTIRTQDGKDVDILCKPGHKSNKLEREAYYGGRVQCFRVGEIAGKIYHIDVNSLYAFVMRSHSFPRRLVRYQEGGTVDDLRNLGTCFGVVARVCINARNSEYPIRIEGRQYHCTGRFWTALCGPELQRAVESGDITNVGTVQVYSIAPLFRDWVDYWYPRKVACDATPQPDIGEREFVKLILTSMSGKFAQSGRHWEDIHGRIPLVRWGAYPERNQETNVIEKWRGIAGHAQLQVEEGEPAHSFPLISAYICAYAREYMREVIGVAGQSECYYMATDSLILSDKGYRNLAANGYVHPTELGKFKVQGQHRFASIVGSNQYTLDSTVVASGMLGKVLAAKANGEKPEQWEQITSLVSGGPRSDVSVSTVDVPMISPDHRGYIDKSGLWHPFRLSFDSDFTDRPEQYRWTICDLQGKEQDRILLNERL